jgi:hypothetical protein
MSFDCYETPTSRAQSIDKFGSTGEREYFCTDNYSQENGGAYPNPNAESDCYNKVIETAPNPEPAFGLERRAIKIKPLGGNFWLATVQYVVPEAYEPYDPLGPEFSAEITAGTVHITQSIKTMSQTANANIEDYTPPQTNRAINVSNKGVGGCDIFSSNCDLTFALRRDLIDIDYIEKLKKACCTMNELTYLGQDPGELLFIGASVQYRGSTGWVVVYRFHLAENQETIEIVPPNNAGAGNDTAGLVITGTPESPAKRGWDYLWVGYVEQAAGAGTLQTPAFANVEQVYNTTDFKTELGWGDADLPPPPDLPGPHVDPDPAPSDPGLDPIDGDPVTFTAPDGAVFTVDAPTEESDTVTFTMPD